MSKRFVGVGTSGVVLHGRPNLALVVAMTGAGGVITAQKVEYEIEKHVEHGGIPEPVARAFIEGVAFGGLTEDEAILRIAAKDMPDVAAPRIADHSELPADNDFFPAWTDDGTNILVDMVKARQIWMSRIREARNLKLTEADNDLETAEDDNDQAEAARIRNRRKALRDIPQNFDLSGAATPAELKDLWPPELADSKPR